ncbi:MAG: hypothetical protein ACJ8AW_49360 [Rhodopila sp.]
MSTITVLLLCLAAGSGLHVYQMLMVIAWLARGSKRRVPTVTITLPGLTEPLACSVSLPEDDKETRADAPPDCPERRTEEVTALSA